MSTAEKVSWTPEQYLARERQATTKSQYYQGQIFAMAGASREHNLIVANLVRLIGNALQGKPCEVYPSDMRVKVQASGLYTYPDVTIVCGDPQFEDAHVDTLINPLVLFEVISESTEGYDRGAKAMQYRKLPSLKQLVLIASDRVQVEAYRRREDGDWTLWESSDLTGTLPIAAAEISLAIAEIYQRVEFAPEQPTTSERGA